MSLGSGGAVTAADVRVPISIDSCEFNNNTSLEYGGALYTTFSKVVLTNCDFNENFSLERGGALYSAITVGYNGYYTHTDNCNFNKNSSTVGGALLYNASSSFCDFRLTNSTFTENSVDLFFDGTFNFGGGAITLNSVDQAVNNTYFVENCIIKNNSSADFGGGILINNFTTEGENIFKINNCIIENNHADNNAGGIGIVNEDDLAEVRIVNTQFINNDSPAGSAFLVGSFTFNPLLDSDIKLINCDFTNHSDSEGFVVGMQDHDVDLINCTIANNESAAIGILNNASAIITNNIIFSGIYPNFVNVGENDTPIRSSGGNMISDNTLGDAARASDQEETLPIFISGTNLLDITSPGIDQGVIHDEITTADLAGNFRIQGGCIDIGAYESPFDAGQNCVLAITENSINENSLLLFPNPANESITIDVENEWESDLNIKIINNIGQLVFHEVSPNSSSSISIPVRTFGSGHYRVVITDGVSIGTASFIKM